MSTYILLAASELCCAACSENFHAPENMIGDNPTKTVVQTTTPVPADCFQPAADQGTVELLQYEAKDYTQLIGL